MTHPTSAPCPWCGMTATRTRFDDDAAEYRCVSCGRSHTRRPDRPGPLAFYPSDVRAAFDAPGLAPLDDADTAPEA